MCIVYTVIEVVVVNSWCLFTDCGNGRSMVINLLLAMFDCGGCVLLFISLYTLIVVVVVDRW